jgi:two-component system cell cycle response regulator DivK
VTGDTSVPGRLAPVGARRTILIVEDDEDNRAIYEGYLTHFGYAVLLAEDAEAGLVTAHSERPDLIAMDVGLPGMDSNAAMQLLKADPATRHIPVVTLAAHALPEDRDAAEAAGCDLYLAKPLEPRVLGAEIRRLLGQEAV